ncbi:MAG: flagellar FlbD family protein [Candidatus Riflebacteria bacterium]
MISLTRINGKPFMLNPDLIEQIEATPDTVISLINGKTIMVAESVDTVARRIICFRRKIFRFRNMIGLKHRSSEKEKSSDR